MNNAYEETKAYWDNVFAHFNRPYPDVVETGIVALDNTILSLGKPKMKALDFGFGSGVLLLMLATRFSGTYEGIELSDEAVALATRLFAHYGLENGRFTTGDVAMLASRKTANYDVFIASNVLDNVWPNDAWRVVNEASRVLKPGGKLFVRLNEYVDAAELKTRQATQLDDDFYQESSGLYLYNLPTHTWKARVAERFLITEDQTISLGEGRGENRVLVLVKK